MATIKIVNGLDADGILQARQALGANPNLAQFKFRARNRWAGGSNCVTTIQDFEVAGQEDTSRAAPFVLAGGEPEVLFGDNLAPNATEAALFALSTCVLTTMVYHAAMAGAQLDEIEVNIEGDLDLRGFIGASDEVRRGFNDIRITFKVKADSLSEEKIQELCMMGQKYSPVFDIVPNKVPVSTKLMLKGTDKEYDVSFTPQSEKKAA